MIISLRDNLECQKIFQRSPRSIFSPICIFFLWLYWSYFCSFNGKIIWSATNGHCHSSQKSINNSYVIFLLWKAFYNAICLVWTACFTWHLVQYIQVSLTNLQSCAYYTQPARLWIWSCSWIELNWYFYFSKNRANLIETGKVKYCHGFLWAQIICIMTFIYISIYSVIPDTQQMLQVQSRFNASRL